MKTFVSEFGHTYKTYSFAYSVYAEKEKEDKISTIYEKGFLPYSGAKKLKNIFYMARGTRLYIPRWKESSENRRVLRLFDGKFKKNYKKVEDLRDDKLFFELCLSYFNLAHGNVMPRERLELILDMGLITSIVEYTENDVPIAYLFLVEDENISHYWLSFYKHGYVKTSLGMWLALDHIREISRTSKKYFYFGTCYAEKSLYKTNVEPLEFWNGEKWIRDTKKLKELCRNDKKREIDKHSDAFKESLDLF